MKKYWPIAILLIAVVFVIGLVVVMRGRGGNEVVDEDENVAEVPVDQRPYTYLVPREDGHWMDLTVENIDVQGAAMIEYEFTYTTSDGRTQGTGGSKPFKAGDDFTSEILIGTTSSGNYYYDEGVEVGELKLKFRNDSGKLIGKLSTPWNLKFEPDSLEFGGLTYTPDDSADLYFVTMSTFGLPLEAPGKVLSGPVGVFASDDAEGKVAMSGGSLYLWDGEAWQSIESGSSVTPGVFIGVTLSE